MSRQVLPCAVVSPGFHVEAGGQSWSVPAPCSGPLPKNLSASTFANQRGRTHMEIHPSVQPSLQLEALRKGRSQFRVGQLY